MSEENAELLKRAVDAYNRRDLEALLKELDPEVEWRPALPGLLGAQAPAYHGHEGIGEMLRDLYDVLDLIHFEYTEVRDFGDRVLALGHIRTRGKASGAETEAAYANVAEIANGKGVRIRGYLDLDEALDAARPTE